MFEDTEASGHRISIACQRGNPNTAFSPLIIQFDLRDEIIPSYLGVERVSTKLLTDIALSLLTSNTGFVYLSSFGVTCNKYLLLLGMNKSTNATCSPNKANTAITPNRSHS